MVFLGSCCRAWLRLTQTLCWSLLPPNPTLRLVTILVVIRQVVAVSLWCTQHCAKPVGCTESTGDSVMPRVVYGFMEESRLTCVQASLKTTEHDAKRYRLQSAPNSGSFLCLGITWGTFKKLEPRPCPVSMKSESLGVGPRHQYLLVSQVIPTYHQV